MMHYVYSILFDLSNQRICILFFTFKIVKRIIEIRLLNKVGFLSISYIYKVISKSE